MGAQTPEEREGEVACPVAAEDAVDDLKAGQRLDGATDLHLEVLAPVAEPGFGEAVVGRAPVLGADGCTHVALRLWAIARRRLDGPIVVGTIDPCREAAPLRPAVVEDESKFRLEHLASVSDCTEPIDLPVGGLRVGDGEEFLVP